jgi:uncharacterized membrane protein YuzA (DUF378 family)
MKQTSTVDLIAMILVLIGGLNWGLVGLADFDLVATLFGAGSTLSKIVYILVGLSAVYLAAMHLPAMMSKRSPA